MNIAEILDQLRTERDKLDDAIEALTAMGRLGSITRRRGRPLGSKSARGVRPTRRRRLSAEARERIAAAQRKRWAEQKKRAKQIAR
jgi:hypothetical protein